MQLLIVLFMLSVAISPALAWKSARADDESILQRIQNRGFPSVFQAWNPADNLLGEHPDRTLARHDLVFHAPDFMGLRWDNAQMGLAVGFTPESISIARARREELLARNPNMLFIAEIRYRDAASWYLPVNHKWWKRNKGGRRMPGWEEGHYYLLDFEKEEFQSQVAAQAHAAVASGVFDGVMLDWWGDDPARLQLIKRVRRAIGPEALILANANDRETPMTAPYINGYFMECYRSETPEDWLQIASTLKWAERHLRRPRINCLETWFHNSREDLNLMRATTAMALTLSEGYCLFSDPNPLPTPDHLHDWYAFWDKSLGDPVSGARAQKNGAIRREFENGTVIYNPMGGRTVKVQFDAPRLSLATGAVSERFEVSPADGDILLKLEVDPE